MHRTHVIRGLCWQRTERMALIGLCRQCIEQKGLQGWFWQCRLYIPDDVDYIEQDLEQLKVMFLADGQGLPPQEIDDLCQPIVELLTVLQLETGILIKNFKDVRCPCTLCESNCLMLQKLHPMLQHAW